MDFEKVYRNEEIGKRIEIDGKKIVFYNEYGNARDGFNHFSELWIEGRHIASAKNHYINRTWESYRYQSVMKKAVNNAIDSTAEKIVKEYKEATGKKKLSKAEKTGIIERNKDIVFFTKLYNAI